MTPSLFDTPPIPTPATAAAPPPRVKARSTRFEIRPQRHSKEWPYDTGVSIYDTVQRRQIGWSQTKAGAEKTIAERQKEVDAGMWDKRTGGTP